MANALTDEFKNLKNRASSAVKNIDSAITVKEQRDFSNLPTFDPAANQSSVPSLADQIGINRVPSGIGFTRVPEVDSSPVIKAEELTRNNPPLTMPLEAQQERAPLAITGIDSAKKAAVQAKTPEQIAKETGQVIPPKETEGDKLTSSLRARIENAIGLGRERLGRGSTLALEEEARQVEEKAIKVQQKSAEIETLAAEYDSLFAGLEGQGRGIPLELIRGQQGAVLRQKAAHISVKEAELHALNGNLELAQNAAQRAVDLKYQDVEARLENELQAIELITPEVERQLNKEETRRLEARQDLIMGQQARVTAAKDLEKALAKVSTTALTNGAPQELVNKAMAAPSELEALRILGSFAGDLLGAAETQARIRKINFDMSLASRKVAQATGETPEEAEAKIQEATDILRIINDITTMEGKSQAVGFGLFKSLPFRDEEDFFSGSAGASFVRTHKQLVNSLTLPNLDKMSGVLSETDIQILQGAATKLSLDLSEDEYDKEVALIKKTFQDTLGEYGIDVNQTTDDYFKALTEGVSEDDKTSYDDDYISSVLN
jgi:hypothetical protein